MIPFALNPINHAIAIAYGKFHEQAQIPTRWEIKEWINAKT